MFRIENNKSLDEMKKQFQDMMKDASQSFLVDSKELKQLEELQTYE